MTLHLATSNGRRTRRRARDPRPANLAQCPRCGGREGIETRTGALLVMGRIVGGTKSLVCVCCLGKGERVELC